MCVCTYLLHIPVLEKRIEHIDLFQLALLILIKRHLGRRRYHHRLRRLIGYGVGFRCSGRLGLGFGFETGCFFDAALEGFLEGDFGAEEVAGPLGEDMLVVFL